MRRGVEALWSRVTSEIPSNQSSEVTTLKIRVLLFSALAMLLLAGLPGPAQAKKQKFPVLVSYGARLHVAGGLTITQTFDDLHECSPGQSYTTKLDSDIEVTKRIKVQVLQRKSVSSSSASEKGAVTNSHKLLDYTESNYCPPDEPAEIDEPECRTITGNGSASVKPDYRQNGKVSLGISRTSGGDQSTSCEHLGINSTPKGSQVESLSTPYSSLELPLNLKARSFLTLGVKKKLIRTVHVGGPCDSAVVYQGKHIDFSAFDAGISTLYNPDTCEVDGTFNFEFKRLNKKDRPPPLG